MKKTIGNILDLTGVSVGAIFDVTEILKDTTNHEYLLYCDLLNIRGEKLHKLFNICCNKNIKTFQRTIKMFQYDVYTQDNIEANLALDNPIPFICNESLLDENKEIDWYEFYQNEREIFIHKLYDALKKQELNRKLIKRY